jgi:Flp pilus assembly protein TadD
MQGIDFRRPRWFLLSVLAVTALTLVVYAPNLEADFVNWDDPSYVYDNWVIMRLTPLHLETIFSSYDQRNYHPLALLSYAIEYAIAGPDPRLFHAVNISFHLANVALVAWLFLLVTGSRTSALLVALLFGIHPYHVESVAWISERRDVLYTFFSLGSIIAWLYSERAGPRTRLLRRGAVFLFLLSCLSKGMAVTQPFVMLLIAYRRDGRIGRRLLGGLTPFFLLTGLFLFIGLHARHISGDFQGDEVVDLINNTGWASYRFLAYWGRAILPLEYSPLYPDHARITGFIRGLSMAAVGALALLTLVSMKRTPKIAFGVLLYGVTLAPVIQFIPSSSFVTQTTLADRYTYFPLLGLFVILADGADWFVRRRPGRIARGVLAAVILATTFGLAWRTTIQVEVWRDSLTLWTAGLRLYPETMEIGYTNRGLAWIDANEPKRALEDFNKALEINPRSALAYTNRGAYHFFHENYEQSLADYARAILLDFTAPQAYIGRGRSLYKLGRREEAIEDLRQAMRLDLRLTPMTYVNLGIIHYELGRVEEAVRFFEDVMEMNPNSAEAANALAWIHGAGKRTEYRDIAKALELAELACLVTNQGHPNYLDTLATVYAAAGRFEEAIATQRRALEIARLENRDALARKIERRLALFEAGKAYAE